MVEVVPSKVYLNLLGLAAGDERPGGGLVSYGGRGTVAIEGRIRDGLTGQVRVLFADREEGKIASINLRSLTWYGHAHAIIDEWADQFVRLVNSPGDERVEDSSPSTLLPW